MKTSYGERRILVIANCAAALAAGDRWVAWLFAFLAVAALVELLLWKPDKPERVIKAGTVNVTLSADTRKFVDGMDEAARATKRWR